MTPDTDVVVGIDGLEKSMKTRSCAFRRWQGARSKRLRVQDCIVEVENEQLLSFAERVHEVDIERCDSLADLTLVSRIVLEFPDGF